MDIRIKIATIKAIKKMYFGSSIDRKLFKQAMIKELYIELKELHSQLLIA